MDQDRKPNAIVPRLARFRLHKNRLGVAVVLALAAWMRFAGVTDVSVRFDDEAAYAHDARLWSRCARVAVDPVALGALVRGDKETIRNRINAIGVDFGERYLKPSQGYTFLGAGAMLLFGDDPSSLAILNAALGTLSVWLLYLIGSMWFNRRIGLLAAALFAVSPYHIFYCRSLWTETAGLFFTLLSLWCWTLGRSKQPSGRRYYLWCGIALGYAVTCHYRYGFMLGPLLIVDWMCRRGMTDKTDEKTVPDRAALSRDTRRSWMTLCVGAALPALLMEGVFQAGKLAAWVVGGELPFPTFLGGVIEWGHIVQRCGLAVTGPTELDTGVWSLFGACYARYHGAVAIGLSLVGVVAIARRRGPARFVLITPVVLLALVSFQRYEILRLFVPTIPMFCLAAAVGLLVVAEPFRRVPVARMASLVILGTLAVVPAVTKAVAVMDYRGDVANACAFLKEHDGLAVLPADTNAQSKYQLYLSTDSARTMHARLYRLGSPEEVLTSLRTRGEVWVVTDPQVWHLRDLARFPEDTIFRWWTEFEGLLQRDAVLVAEFPHLTNSRWEFLAEGPGIDMIDEMRARDAGAIRIYHLPESAPVERFSDDTVTLGRK